MTITLEQVNKNILEVKQELEKIKGYLEEDSMELTDDVKKQIEESRKRPISSMKSQKEIEKKFL